MSAIERVQDMVRTAGELTRIIAAENEALKAFDGERVQGLLERKDKLSRIYEAQFTALLKDPSRHALDEETRSELNDTMERLQDAAEQNAKLLKTAIDSGKRVMDVVAEAARRAGPGAGTYSARGSLGNEGRSARGVPVSLDKSL